MKIYNLIGIIVLTILSFSCQDDEMSSNLISCLDLKEGLIALDDEVVKAEIDAICQDFPPKPITNDVQGHEANLDAIIIKLNDECPEFTTTLGCYACLQSYPPQSVVTFMVDSAGVTVQRGIRLLTPNDEVMTFLGVN